METLREMPIAERCEVVRYCRVDKMYNQDKKRLTLCIERTPVRLQMLQALELAGAEKKQGRAPKNHMVNELQDWLEALLAE